MSVFVRSFLFDPGAEVLLEIESVNVLDLDPPASITGVGTGTVLLVGEYENGPFATGGNAAGYSARDAVLEVVGTNDLVNMRGELGYQYGGAKGQNPCARARRSDNATTTEYWNGNAFIQMNAKRFRRLLTARADTSVGYVEFRRQAFVTGAAAFAYNLEPGQILAVDIGAGPVSATFTATAATITSAAQTFPTTFTGGETLTLGIDDKPDFTVTFLAADQTQAQTIARINAAAGFSMAATVTGTTMSLTGLQRGNAAQVRVVGASAAGVLTALGLTVGTTMGTGNVGNIDAATFLEIRTVVQAAVAGASVEQDSAGRLRITKTFAAADDYVRIGPATTATALGFTVGQHGSADGIASIRSGAQTFPTATTGTFTLGADDEPNFTVTLPAAQSQAQVIALINAAAGYTMASAASATIMLLRGRANGGQVRVVGASAAAVLTQLGLTIGTVTTSAALAARIPAGTEVRNTDGTRVFVTMQDVSVLAPTGGGPTGAAYTSNAGPYAVKIRHALDDGSGQSATAGTLTALPRAPDAGSFAVINPQAATVALTEAQIDAQYVAAIEATLDLNSVAREANVIWAARQSNAIRRALRVNALTAKSIGMLGRMAVLRTPLGTTKSAAMSRVAEPGVGAYRDQRVIFCHPQANSYVPLVARLGLAGGAGFTADGNVDIGADGFMASILSQLPPEENPGQLTPFAAGANSLESSPNAQGLQMGDYTNFRKAGIAALRIDDGVAIFQSGVTSVDSAVQPQFQNIARRRMADFIQDTLARRLKNFGKKLNSFARRKAVEGEVRSFMALLHSEDNPNAQRIDSFSLKAVSTQAMHGAGRFRLSLKARTLSSLDSIELETVIGEQVDVNELPVAA